ncbi:DHA1 family inner membrane transport protein [Catenulispora sp. EB89]|uniref:MFS transporter n=1 Tax=Catenulispora sp. EB89 TaxID=3156257 RepID=UPI003519CC28
MSAQKTALSPGRTNLALATLFLGMFVLGSGELLVVGVLNRIATDFHVSISSAGHMVTVYALGLAIGGPLLTAATIRLEKKLVLVAAVTVFIACNLLAVLTHAYGLFLVLRFGIGALQGLFIAAAFTAVMTVVPPERIGQAIGIVISGVALSGALGLPLGTLVGQTLGWRGSFLAIVVGAAVVLIGTVALIPTTPPTTAGAAHQARHAFAPRVLAVLFLNFIVFSAVFAPLTYLVPFLQHVTGISGAMLSVFLLAYGAATAVGSFGGGTFADRNASRTLIIGSAGIAASLLALSIVGSIPWLVPIALLALGLSFYSCVPSLQVRVIALAGPGGELAQSLPVSAANIGIAFGSFAGGIAITNHSASATVLTGLLFALVTSAVAWGTSFLQPPALIEESSAAVDRSVHELA